MRNYRFVNKIMRLGIMVMMACFVFIHNAWASTVPFTPQAPFGDWDDLRQQEGCEEASILMALAWAKGEALSYSKALQEIIKLSEYQEKTYGFFGDTSAATTFEIIQEYFHYHAVELKENISADDVIEQLNAGHVVIAPMDGRALNNPNFTPPGPQYHMIVFHGYDAQKKEFITHDPGTRRGANYRYSYATIQNSLRDYPDGLYEELKDHKTAMIVFKKEDEVINSVKGKIILQVEDKGQAYYIPPTGTGLFFLGRALDAYILMREQGQGITNADLLKFPIGFSHDTSVDSDGDGISDRLEYTLQLNPHDKDTDGDGFADKEEIESDFSPWEKGVVLPIDLVFAKQHAGKIFLQVEQRGEAWYINPSDLKRYYLGTPTDAFSVIRKLGLGVSNIDFLKVTNYFTNALKAVKEAFDGLSQ